MAVVYECSPDIIPSGGLGSDHRLTNFCMNVAG